jgi:hypothetical protein
MSANLLWIMAVIVAIIGIIVLISGSIIWGIILLIVAALIGPGGYSIFRGDQAAACSGDESVPGTRQEERESPDSSSTASTPRSMLAGVSAARSAASAVAHALTEHRTPAPNHD